MRRPDHPECWPFPLNRSGGTFGGPVAIPKLFHPRDSFFFVGYQKTINHEVAVSSTAATLPTAAQLNGTFANEKSCIVNPLQPNHVYPCTPNGSTFTTQVDIADYSPASIKLLQYLPPPSSLNANGSISFQKPSFYDLSEIAARYDQGIGQKDRLAVRYFQDYYHLDGVLDQTDLLTYADEADIKYYNSLISETHFSPTRRQQCATC